MHKVLKLWTLSRQFHYLSTCLPACVHFFTACAETWFQIASHSLSAGIIGVSDGKRPFDPFAQSEASKDRLNPALIVKDKLKTSQASHHSLVCVQINKPIKLCVLYINSINMPSVGVSSSVPYRKQLYQSVIQSSTPSRTTATSNYPRNLLYSSSRRRELTSPRPKSSSVHLHTSQNLDSGYGGGGCACSSTSDVSPPLHIYSWEDEERMPVHRSRVGGSMDRLSRSAFDLDIPDMQTTREEREKSRREMHELNEKLADQLDGVCNNQLVYILTYLHKKIPMWKKWTTYQALRH